MSLMRMITEFFLLGDDVEKPSLFADADIEAPHVAGRHFLREGNIVNLRTHHHDIATDDGWRGDAVVTPVDSTTQPLRQVNAPLLAESGNGLARLRVQTDQVAVASAEEDALIAPIRPAGNASMYEAVIGRCSVLPRLGVVNPPGSATSAK
jgi:hypothetical protein